MRAVDGRTEGSHHSGLAGLVPNLLRSIDVTIETRLAPEVESSNGKVLVDVIRSLLYWAIQQLDAHDAAFAARLAAYEAEREAPSNPKIFEFPTAAEQAFENFAAKQKVDPESPEWIARLLRGEETFRTIFDPEAAADPATAYHGGKSSGRPSFRGTVPKIDAATISTYLRRKFPDHPGIEVAKISFLPGGFSKETILLTIAGHPGITGDLIIRKDLNTPPTHFSSLDEFPLLQYLFGAGLPVAEPLWAEASAAVLGAPFIVVRRVAGVVALEALAEHAPQRGMFVTSLATELAKLHALPPYIVTGADMPGCIRAQIDALRSFWTKHAREPSLPLETLFAWAEQNIPADPGFAPVIVHGDYGFHNLMASNGEVTAILDWEFSHIGDPAEDVAYCRQFLEPMGAWEKFLDAYASAGGKPFDAKREEFFAIWQNLRNAVYSCGALDAFARGLPGDIKMAAAGINIQPRFELAALRQILAITKSHAA